MEIGTQAPNITLKYKLIIALLSGTFYAGILYLFDQFYDELTYSQNGLLIQGLLFGLFFGFGFTFIIQKYGRQSISAIGSKITPILTENETVEVEGPANLFRGVESVGGKLFLTNKKLIFKSHNLNIQTGQTDIEYENIVQVFHRKTIGLVYNGIGIKTKGGTEYDLVLNDRESWLAKINEKINASN